MANEAAGATSRVDADVLISGGGPVGMGLAIELGQRGVRTIVVERHSTPQPIPKGQNLTQRTMEHFRSWHCEDALRAARTIPVEYGIGGLTAYGTLLSGHHYDWLQRDVVRSYYAADNERLPQYATETVLRARAAELDCVDVRYGWTVDGALQNDDHAELSIVSRTGERERLTGRYLVGCDGSRSIAREQAGISQSLSDHDRLMVLLVFRSKELSRLLERFPGKSYYNVLHPSQKGYWLFFGRVSLDDDWFFHAPVPPEAREPGFDFVSLLHEAVGAAFDVAIDHVGFWDLRFAIADAYGKGRIFVAGDAAHSHPPYGGYGINTGFEDARNLGWKLAATVQGWGGDALLASYHAERHGVFASTASDFIAKSIETDRAFLESYDPERDAEAFADAWGERRAGASGEVIRFEPNYRGSPIVFGDPASGCTALGSHSYAAEAGRHLAPQILSSGMNVPDARGTGFTLLAFGADAGVVSSFKEAAAALGVPLDVVEDGNPGLRDAYGATLILVRPDQFVAWTGSGVEHAAADALERSTGRLSR